MTTNLNLEKQIKDWEKLFNPNEVKFQLISGSIFITAYDSLISTIVEKVKDFYTDDFVNGAWTKNAQYEEQVRKLFKKDIIIASMLWLNENNVLTETDIELVKNLRIHRNEIAHELSSFLFDSEKTVKLEYIDKIKELNFKIHKWWFTEYEMCINPELGNLNIDELNFEEVLIFPMLPINYMKNIIDDELKKRVNGSDE